MLPYQIYQALADQHIRDLVTAAEHHPRKLPERSSRLGELTTRILARLQVAGGARTRSTTTPVSGAGPMGCRA